MGFCVDYLKEVIKIKDRRKGKLTSSVLLHQNNAPAYKPTVARASIRERGFQFV